MSRRPTPRSSSATCCSARRNVRGNGSGTYGTFQVTKDNPFYVNPNGTTNRSRVQYNFLDDLGPQLATAEVTQPKPSPSAWISRSPGDWVLTAQTGIANEKIDLGVTNTVKRYRPRDRAGGQEPGDGIQSFSATARSRIRSRWIPVRALRKHIPNRSSSQGSLVAHGPLLARSRAAISSSRSEVMCASRSSRHAPSRRPQPRRSTFCRNGVARSGRPSASW